MATLRSLAIASNIALVAYAYAADLWPILPGAGWAEFDPTNGIVGNNNLIRIAVTRGPRQAIPLSGTWFGKAEECLGMTVEVIMRRIDGT